MRERERKSFVLQLLPSILEESFFKSQTGTWCWPIIPVTFFPMQPRKFALHISHRADPQIYRNRLGLGTQVSSPYFCVIEHKLWQTLLFSRCWCTREQTTPEGIKEATIQTWNEERSPESRKMSTVFPPQQGITVHFFNAPSMPNKILTFFWRKKPHPGEGPSEL